MLENGRVEHCRICENILTERNALCNKEHQHATSTGSRAFHGVHFYCYYGDFLGLFVVDLTGRELSESSLSYLTYSRAGADSTTKSDALVNGSLL